ncbi:MAG TPA: hypothetical protein PKE26_15800 [Kiritimatiellia bacterium]|nr:hypothetical protein [Kiritimatiellia bacterium]HMP00560.1 hypothetical protein [Kiritimatiellia bacterium]
MVQKLNRLIGRTDFRTLVFLSVLAVLVTIGWAYAQLSDESNTVSSYEELVAHYLDYRQGSYMLCVPSWYLYKDQVEIIESQYGLAGFQDQPDWYFNFNVGNYYIAPDSDLAKLAAHDTQLIIYEDMVKGELLVVRDTGDAFEEEIVYKSPAWPEQSKLDLDADFLFKELSKRRVVWHVTLKDAALAEEEYAAMLAAQNSEFENGGMMMLMGDPEDLTITAIRQTNGTSVTIGYPEDFTNRLDIFTCADPSAYIWQIATEGLDTAGTNSITWVDSATWPGNTRVYVAGNADLDTDEDGFSDAREILVFQTNPENSNSYPVEISGTISYGGSETGTIYVVADTIEDSWTTGPIVSISSPGGYTNAAVAINELYWLGAYMDVNGNQQRESWEPSGVYTVNPLVATSSLSGINITISDSPSIFGRIQYSGSSTGDVYVIAIASSNTWSSEYQTIIPWDQGLANETGGVIYLTFPVSYGISVIPAGEYWLRAFIDSNGDGIFNSGVEDGGQHALSSVSVSNRVMSVDIVIADDDDSDGLPDWWEWQYFGNLNYDDEDDPDGDGFNNMSEFLGGTLPNSTIMNGDQLVADFLNANGGGPGLYSMSSAGLRVDVQDSENCEGSNNDAQTVTDVYNIGPLQDCGYIINVTVEGIVEAQDSGFDYVSINDTTFFSSEDNDAECNMTYKNESEDVLFFSSGSVTLKYDTIDGLFHQGAYAEVIGATLVGLIRIDTETIATTPANRSRTLIGLGEEVLCSVPAPFVVDWEVIPDTAGEVDQPTGSGYTTFTAAKTPHSSATLRATFPGGGQCEVTFTIIEPNGVIYDSDTDDVSPYPGCSPPPKTYIGNGRLFPFTFLPTTVSFYNVRFRENKPGDSWTWPNGDSDSYGGGIVGPLSVGYANTWFDQISAAAEQYYRLETFWGHRAFVYSIRVPWEYERSTSTWIEFISNSGNKHYRIYNSSGSCSIKAVANNIKQSSYRGPWSGFGCP